jgi:hypothetical protein
MKIKSQKDFFSGLLFMGFGIAFTWGAATYKVGQADRMGPGYFPLMLGVLMTVLGVLIIVKALAVKTESGDRIGGWAWKPLVYVLGANLAFGVLLGGLPSIKLPAFGIVAGIYVLTIVASLAGRRFDFRRALLLATVLAAFSYLAFIVLLKLQIPAWPAFIAG